MYIGEIIMKKNIQHTTKVGKILSIILFQINHRTRNSLIQRTILSEGYATDSIFPLSHVLKGTMRHKHSQKLNLNTKIYMARNQNQEVQIYS